MLAAKPLCTTADLRIGRYETKSARYAPYDPESPRVAARVIEAIVKYRPILHVEHIGSTAVPGCGGKGIVDLLVAYPAGSLELARLALDELGFQRQGGPDVFPESRPMRVGAVRYRGQEYPVHAHVICSGDRQALDLITFRDRLRADGALVRAYQEEKLSILSRGITVCTEYSKAKTDFIRGVLAAAR